MSADGGVRADSPPVPATPPRRIVWLVRAGGWLVRLLGATWRIHVRNDGEMRRLRSAKQPIIFTIWHGELLPLLYQHQRQGVAVLISEHGDGEIIARVATNFGYGTVRGSTSRGAVRALLAMARVIDDGHDLAITPDGPRGPAKSFALGPVVVAQRTGAPVIGVSVTASRAWRFKSWDRFMVPAPFARVTITYTDAMRVDSRDARDVEALAERVRALMTTDEQRAGG